MGVINYSDQLKFTGKGYLDSKMMPVEKVSDLYNISITQRFEGLTVTVLKDEDGNSKPQDYWLIGGVSNSCWIPKTVSGYNNDLKLILENGFLKLMNGNEQLGDEINLNEFFPSQPDEPGYYNDMYISSVDYTYLDDNNNNGIFLCFTYSDNTKKYLDMSQFLSQTYEPGNGIVIENNIISIDDAIFGRIQNIENSIETQKIDIADIKEKISNISSIINTVNENSRKISENTLSIEQNKLNITTLEERVNALSSVAEGSTPDGRTIGITNDERKALYVKVLEKDGNMLKVGTHEGNSGLFVSIPVFYEDEDLK